MAIVAAAVRAPSRHVSPSLPALPNRHGSSLNPQFSGFSTPIKCSSATSAAAAKIHLANLDRILLPSPAPQCSASLQLEHKLAQPPKNDCSGGSEGGGMLTNLFGDLASIFPDLLRLKPEADEIMSPGSMKRLQRLLSDSSRLSPRNCIADKWRELHGAKAWEGLLDPLDENLRRELVRYGDFVQAAYHAFHSLPSPAASPSSRHRHLLLPDRSYRPTKSLFATSSLDVPGWAQTAAPQWLTQRSSWIGYVAVCENEREVRRMGRRDIAIVLRGTATGLEWAENLRPALVPVDERAEAAADAGERRVPKVVRGFLSLYETAGEKVPSLATAVVEEVRRLTEAYKGEKLSITVTGHSLGAALALLVADELSVACGPEAPPIAVISFGGPRVGNAAFAERVKRRGVNVLRVVNDGDVVTRVPLAPGLPHVRDVYEHVGAELRVDNRVSPYLKPDAGPSFSHDLEAYLHLVDGFNGTGYGFRSDAKRSLIRLLELQGPNIKKVYARRAQAIRPYPIDVRLPAQCNEPVPLASPSN
ncbi:hypothetical protein Cni_G14838 [Canna indica]|uniref:Fungal lipase-type domain-containing protein n=1 Tax=Canna indica TaxID=4628 RepID=A0AAQ3QE70_9LILI|nr:hypothetical protein Cni_G14838 [Canna indica]